MVKGFRVLGFTVLGFRVSWFRLLGFRVLGFRGLGGISKGEGQETFIRDGRFQQGAGLEDLGF